GGPRRRSSREGLGNSGRCRSGTASPGWEAALGGAGIGSGSARTEAAMDRSNSPGASQFPCRIDRPPPTFPSGPTALSVMRAQVPASAPLVHDAFHRCATVRVLKKGLILRHLTTGKTRRSGEPLALAWRFALHGVVLQSIRPPVRNPLKKEAGFADPDGNTCCRARRE